MYTIDRISITDYTVTITLRLMSQNVSVHLVDAAFLSCTLVIEKEFHAFCFTIDICEVSGRIQQFP